METIADPKDGVRPDPELTELLHRCAAVREVPGASLAVLAGDDIRLGVSGVTSHRTGVEVDVGTVFQIGSITKVWTATMIMQLVAEGRCHLDAPVRDVLGEFRVADRDVTRSVTIRHLLSHTSGIDGDVFIDTGRGDDCLARYVEACASLGQVHPLGATMSYCNSGYVVLGRLIEVLDGRSWDASLAHRIVAPLALADTVTLPEEAILRRAATGHLKIPGRERPVPAPLWGLYRSAGPAGLITSTASDLARFARAHLRGGLADDGTTRILASESVAAMQARQVEVPDPWGYGDGWGLGWCLSSWDGHRTFGHDGATLGQAAFLRIFPDIGDHGTAVCLLTNGGDAKGLWRDIATELLGASGVRMPSVPPVPDRPVSGDFDAYVGRYENIVSLVDIERVPDGFELVHETRGPLAALLPETVRRMRIHPVDDRLWLIDDPSQSGTTPVVFYDVVDGRPNSIHSGARCLRRVG